MTASGNDWRPSASRARLELRAALLARLREFFAARRVLEVETPACVQYAVTDPQLRSLRVEDAGTARHLHTSPEYAMKRLLAAGSGDIYQLCHVFRGGEAGPLHNPEFTMLEWYRLGFGMAQLMQEVEQLLRDLLGQRCSGSAEAHTYQSLLQRNLGVDVLACSEPALRECAAAHGFEPELLRRCTRDQLLDLLMGAVVGPTLGMAGPCFVTHYPASQAALARLDPRDARVALRFELYLRGMELANGFEELTDAAEQAARFARDREQRRAGGMEEPAADPRLLAALTQGLPACSGVALGFDRLLMVAADAAHIDEVLAFPAARA